MKIIRSTCGKEIMVSDEDFDYLNHWRWHVDRISDCVVRSIYPNKIKTTIYMANVVMDKQGISHPQEIDHKDRNRLNNQRENLRPATRSQNNMNQGIRKDNRSGYKGVSVDGTINKYIAQLYCKKTKVYKGGFYSKEDAAIAYDSAARKYHGEFAVLNFPNEDIVAVIRRYRQYDWFGDVMRNICMEFDSPIKIVNSYNYYQIEWLMDFMGIDDILEKLAKHKKIWLQS